MKLEGLDHPKTLDFAARLNVTRPTAIGHLELLWAFCATKAPQGDIGKWPDGAIARACEWMGDPQSFLVSLLESGLVDAHQSHRYVVHDWHEHAPGWVRAKLQKVGLAFLTTSEPTSERSSERTSERSTRADLNQAKPSLTKPNQAPDSRARTREPGEGREGKGPDDTAKGQTADTPKRRTPKKPEIPIPEDFAIDPELEQYALDNLPDVDVTALGQKFRLQAETKQWRYADWRKAFQTYVRNARPDSGHWATGQYPRKRINGNGTHRPTETVAERELRYLERYIREGLSDAQIAEQLEFMPVETIRAKRQEIEHAGQH